MGTEWLAENDPCPAGWRVPTNEDFEKLCDETNVSRIWSDTPAGYTFTDTATGNTLFLPVAGFRGPFTGTLRDIGEYSYYWTVSKAVSLFRSCFQLARELPEGVSELSLIRNSFVVSVRCVAK
jgi:uncharacterized protein (TIGR02145 family)